MNTPNKQHLSEDHCAGETHDTGSSSAGETHDTGSSSGGESPTLPSAPSPKNLSVNYSEDDEAQVNVKLVKTEHESESDSGPDFPDPSNEIFATLSVPIKQEPEVYPPAKRARVYSPPPSRSESEESESEEFEEGEVWTYGEIVTGIRVHCVTPYLRFSVREKLKRTSVDDIRLGLLMGIKHLDETYDESGTFFPPDVPLRCSILFRYPRPDGVPEDEFIVREEKPSVLALQVYIQNAMATCVYETNTEVHTPTAVQCYTSYENAVTEVTVERLTNKMLKKAIGKHYRR